MDCQDWEISYVSYRGNIAMFESITETTGTARPAPMEELTVGAFAMETHAQSSNNGNWHGRPVALVAICRRTLMVAGVHVARDGVTFYEVMQCLADAFLPRDAVDVGAVNPWPCEGVSDRAFVHAQHDLTPAPFRRFREALGLEVLPHHGPEPLVSDLAERWSQEAGIEIDSLHDGRAALAHRLADRPLPRGDAIELENVDRKLRRWIVDRYNAASVPGIGRSPLDLWREAAIGFVPRFVPEDAPGDLFRPEAFRTIGPRGVTWGGRTYWSEAVPDLLEKWGGTREYEVKADPANPLSVEVRTPERKWVRLEAMWV